MELRDELLTVAELAVGIAGFSAIVAMFSRQGEYHLADVNRFRALFTTAAAAVGFAFVPVLLSDFGFSGQSLWRVASAIMIALWIAQVIPTSLSIRKLRQEDRANGPTRPFLLAVFVPAVLNAILQVLNTSAVVWSPTGGVYLIGTLVYLWCSAAAFVDLVLHRPAT